jgi:RNA polymerase sigma-70 factor (ECF subfamily)
VSSTSTAALADLSEPDLVGACLAGRSEAFDLIVERHRRSVYQLCYRFVGNHEDASDLSQEVFLRAYRGLRNFRGQSALATWLYRIGVNVCLSRVGLKTPPNESIGERQLVDTRTESPSERVLKQERAQRVRAAIAELPRKQRATLILRMYHELSHRNCGSVEQLGWRRQSQFLSRAGQPPETARRGDIRRFNATPHTRGARRSR